MEERREARLFELVKMCLSASRSSQAPQQSPTRSDLPSMAPEPFPGAPDTPRALSPQALSFSDDADVPMEPAPLEISLSSDSSDSDFLENPRPFSSLASLQVNSNDPVFINWILFPDGNRTYLVNTSSYSDVQSTGYVWLKVSSKGSAKSGKFYFKRRCGGTLECEHGCGYVQRPFVGDRTAGRHAQGKRKYAEKDYRQYCRGICAERGSLSVALLHKHCQCELIIRSRGMGMIVVTHTGEHMHGKPPVVRATARELEVYKLEAQKTSKVKPKKKASPSNPSAPLMRMWTLSASGSTGLELRQHGTWSLS